MTEPQLWWKALLSGWYVISWEFYFENSQEKQKQTQSKYWKKITIGIFMTLVERLSFYRLNFKYVYYNRWILEYSTWCWCLHIIYWYSVSLFYTHWPFASHGWGRNPERRNTDKSKWLIPCTSRLDSLSLSHLGSPIVILYILSIWG